MAIQNSEPNTASKAASVIFPNAFSFFTESLIGLLILGLSLLQEWDLLGTVRSDSDVIERIKNIYNSLSDTIASTSYGRVAVTIIFWAIIGVLCYVLVTKVISYFSVAWQIMDEKQHDVFPRWYSGGSLFHDMIVRVCKWFLRHVLAVVLLIFALFFCLPISIAYAHIGVYGGDDRVYIAYSALSLIFATRLFGMSLCIFSKKITAWYAR